MQHLLTFSQVCRLGRCCDRTIRRRIARGTFPPPRRIGKFNFWLAGQVRRALARR